jgi:uncharacterized protein YcgI (DUF1989 family)
MPEVLVKGAHGGRIRVRRGQRLEIVNVEGGQVCDFFAFNADNVRETLSPAHTRSVLRRLFLKPGDRLVSVLRRPMFEIVEDTVGVHDFCMPQCDPERYIQSFGIALHRNCRTNLAEAVADLHVPYEYLPEPFNFFQPTPVLADGTFGLSTSPAKAGDRIVLAALMDAIAAASACPQDQTPLNKFRPTDIRLVVGDA